MRNTQYNIKYSSMDQFYIEMCNRIGEWHTQLESWSKSFNNLINMKSFDGQAAEKVKAYLGEVHVFLLEAIYTSIERLQSDYLLYKKGYYNIEGNIYANISSETIKSIQTKLSDEIRYLNNIKTEIDRSLNSVSDIYRSGRPSNATLDTHLNSEKNALTNLNKKIEDYESNKYSVANGEVRSLLEALKRTIVQYSGSTNSVVSYNSGDIANNTEVLDLYQKMLVSKEYVKNNQKEIELAAVEQQEVFAQMQKDYEEACKAREDEGWAKVIAGGAAVVAGGLAIFLTAGAATPIVVTACVTGGSSILYGVSNVHEGACDVYYGSIGDLDSAAVNPIRDTIFMGNQTAYDVWGNLNMTIAGLCAPVSKSVNVVAGSSGTVIAKQVGFTIGKEMLIDKGIDFASSNITNFAADKLNLNKTSSTILNMGLSFGIQKGVDAIDMKISGPPSFAEGMSYNDAKRYNERNTKLESGEYTGYPGLSDADVKAWQFADSKLNEHIAISKVDPNEVVNIRMKEIELQNKQKSIDSGGNKSANNVPDASIRKQQSIIKSVEDGSVKLETNIQKGNYGEMKMDNYFESQGYQRISNNRVIDLNEPTHQGIDGVYCNPGPPPKYVIAEAKYNTSKLSDTKYGKQMSDAWIEGSNRLEKAVGRDLADVIFLEGYDRTLVNVSNDGNVVAKMLDENGNVIR